jgi:hypothetical protein
MTHILPLNDMQFPNAGDYAFGMRVGNDRKVAGGLGLPEAGLEQRALSA